MHTEDGASGKCQVPGLRVTTSKFINDDVHQQDVDHMQHKIEDVIALCRDAAPVVVQTIGCKKQLTPSGADSHNVPQGMNIEELRILEHDLLIIENEVTVQTVCINSNR